ncbi:hypothetical protein [Pacificoceanicola onchidii]|uniref:hypothetical protein n=1 Tax=Pacificoceanicola onchidii TaxID=2562685 RepID=UPI0010A2CA9E|nr:hypothetical protein [Pacificoceanicola onchidii]
MKDHSINFLEFLQTFRRGELLREVDHQLAKVTDAMHETGGDGELTIKLPFKFNKAGQIECVPSIAAKPPKKPMGTGLYFLTDEGRLSRRDPNQMDIEDEIERRRAAE